MPRFVFNLGAEQNHSLPDDVMIVDTLTGKPVVSLHAPYTNAICLEQVPDWAPFTALLDWFNETSNHALASEGVPIPEQAMIDLKVLDVIRQKYPKASYEHPGFIQIPFESEQGFFSAGTVNETWGVDACEEDGIVFSSLATDVSSDSKDVPVIAAAVLKAMDEIVCL